MQLSEVENLQAVLTMMEAGHVFDFHLASAILYAGPEDKVKLLYAFNGRIQYFHQINLEEKKRGQDSAGSP